MSSSILADFLAGRALPEQWIGLAILATLGFVGLILLLRQHVVDTKDESRTIRGRK